MSRLCPVQQGRAGWRVQVFSPVAKALSEREFISYEHFHHRGLSGQTRWGTNSARLFDELKR